MATAQDAARASRVAPRVYHGDGWSLAAPASWTLERAIVAPTVLKLRGDAADGFPDGDGMLAPLGLTIKVDRYGPAVGRIDMVADLWKKETIADRRSRLAGKIVQRRAKLTGGVDAIALLAHKGSEDRREVSDYYAVICAGKTGHTVAVTGSLRYGRASSNFVRAIGLPEMLKSHVASVTVDEVPVDKRRLAKAYAGYQWQAAEAIRMTRRANLLLRDHQLTQAAAAYRRALQLCDDLPAAHQKLAWLHLSATDPKLLRPQTGLAHALVAVRQTEGLDIAALDTLALAYIKTGQPKKAAEMYRNALKNDPDNQTLRQRLTLYE